jgi:hypothetical protein
VDTVRFPIVSVCILAFVMGGRLKAAEPQSVGVVSHVKVLSDKVEDVSSLQAWQKSFIEEGMSDEKKALAIWESVLKFRHQDAPPQELFLTGCVHDPIKTFNVYGYGMCCCASCNIATLSRHVGLQARGWGINAHSVPEVSWDQGKSWHMLDASLLTYFPKADGQIAGVEELVSGVQGWYEKNAGLRKDNDKLVKFMGGGGWKKGPDILSRCPFYDNNGWFLAATHGWYSTMQEYDCKPFIYEYGYSQGYQVNVQLRKGERLTRNWSNHGLHINMDGSGGAPGCLNTGIGTNDLRYAPKYGDLANGRIGNGTHLWEVPLEPALRAAALTADNLAFALEDKTAPALHVKDAAKPGELVLRLPSSYVYLGGELMISAVIAAGGKVAVTFSDNNGLDWREVTTIDKSGEQRVNLSLKPFVYRRYDYRLKFTISGAGTGLRELVFRHSIQHSQRALPALAAGKNTITFDAGAAEGTITIEGSTNPKVKGKQLISADFHPVIEGVAEGPPTLKGGQGSITFPIATPGDMVRLRFGCHYRARDAKDGWDLQVSFDNGQTFKTVDRAAGPTPGLCKYVTFGDVPAGTRQALVRFAGTQRNTTCLFDYRIDADYKEPHGGFQPVVIEYRWEENGQAKQDVHIARKAQETYTITCTARPVMKSITVELAE